jgi:hypothetical protein
MDAWIAKRKNNGKETTVCHNEMGASIKKMEPNSGEVEAVVGRQKIPNEEVAVHSLRACRSETVASQETTEADTEQNEPDKGMMQSIAEYLVARKEDSVVKPVKGRKKQHTGRKKTRLATVAWGSENIIRKVWIRNQSKQRTPKRRKDGERLRKGPECNNGMRNRSLR